MYRWMRNTHLFLGLFTFLFLLVYAVSSVQMAHNQWFSTRPTVSESRISIPAENGASARVAARFLMDQHHLRGELAQVRQAGSGFSFRIVRPGTVYEVDYSRAAGEAKVRTNVAGFMGMLNRIHHVGGLWHEYRLLNIWGVFVAVVSAGLILMALTGIYLWFMFHNERVIGAVLLAVSLAYSLTLMVLIRTAS